MRLKAFSIPSLLSSMSFLLNFTVRTSDGGRSGGIEGSGFCSGGGAGAGDWGEVLPPSFFFIISRVLSLSLSSCLCFLRVSVAVFLSFLLSFFLFLFLSSQSKVSQKEGRDDDRKMRRMGFGE